MMFQVLWRRAESEGAHVTYTVCSDGEYGTFGFEDDRPTIRINGSPGEMVPLITTPQREATPEMQFHQLNTLAHEYGHYRSQAPPDRSEYLAAYRRALDRRDELRLEARRAPPPPSEDARHQFHRVASHVASNLLPQLRDRILAEEKQAWDFGREALRTLGLQDFSEYDRRETDGLRKHRAILGLEQLRPDDR